MKRRGIHIVGSRKGIRFRRAAARPVGNQTKVKTSTGIWHVAYNAENRPAVWSNGTAVVTMDFDRMGRRVWYKSISGAQTNATRPLVWTLPARKQGGGLFHE